MEQQVGSPVQVMRVLKLAFLLSVFCFFYTMIEIPQAPQQPVGHGVEVALTVVALACVAMGFLVPRYLDRSARQKLEGKPAAAQLSWWMTKGILRLAYFEACVLLGFALHFLGARFGLPMFLFGVGFLAMLFANPGPPPSAEDGKLLRS
jgi:hypothetical protein